MMAKLFYSNSYAKEELKSRYTQIYIFNNIKHLLALDIAICDWYEGKFISEP